nr:immunoglobulin light chain junction region [Macaca mulatta]MOX23517.1 immunoglobulin light chain junction region [Macaca mulatta]MOX23825.1 immunoglobulin light chain junction region [Macaca mulatta]MOX24232.1 immunoglobulin light chain junction region [Macaca mulatta]MOX24616.1 immunoglobulin light chain junction region [Macaca mulatta]
CQQGYIIPFTF